MAADMPKNCRPDGRRLRPSASMHRLRMHRRPRRSTAKRSSKKGRSRFNQVNRFYKPRPGRFTAAGAFFNRPVRAAARARAGGRCIVRCVRPCTLKKCLRPVAARLDERGEGGRIGAQHFQTGERAAGGTIRRRPGWTSSAWGLSLLRVETDLAAAARQTGQQLHPLHDATHQRDVAVELARVHWPITTYISVPLPLSAATSRPTPTMP